ncbi:hypothetical protein GOP47_0019005 [Adiantum capillus-veneris]|uniref:MADS-box domain-containing protein n=1 Tax=Adiantum capillus-veneris TaxID=13818 RepID=A0A9D4UEA8_ADICA|nr:hypothetical protein GOP47_0019005 [Adiantum capillus-veneris]
MGRAKLENVMLGSKSSRKECFNKRCRGVFKKVYELAHICGASVRLTVEGEDGNIYHFHRRMSQALVPTAIANDLNENDISPSPPPHVIPPTHSTLAYNNFTSDSFPMAAPPPDHTSYKDIIPVNNHFIPGPTPIYSNGHTTHASSSYGANPSYGNIDEPAINSASASFNYHNNNGARGKDQYNNYTPLSNGGCNILQGITMANIDEYGDNMQELSMRNTNNNHMMMPQAIMLPPHELLPNSRASARPPNRLMFYNGGRTMVDTGVPVSRQLRQHLVSPQDSCNCFDCNKGFSARFFETITINHSLPPLHGDDRPFFQKAPFMGNIYFQASLQSLHDSGIILCGPLEAHEDIDMMASVANFISQECPLKSSTCSEPRDDELMLQGCTFDAHDDDSRQMPARTQEEENDGAHAIMALPIIEFPKDDEDPMGSDYGLPIYTPCCCGKKTCDDFIACLANSLHDENQDFEASQHHVVDYIDNNINTQHNQTVNIDDIMYQNFIDHGANTQHES